MSHPGAKYPGLFIMIIQLILTIVVGAVVGAVAGFVWHLIRLVDREIRIRKAIKIANQEYRERNT